VGGVGRAWFVSVVALEDDSSSMQVVPTASISVAVGVVIVIAVVCAGG